MPYCSPMTPDDLLTPAEVSGTDLQALGCHFLSRVSQVPISHSATELAPPRPLLVSWVPLADSVGHVRAVWALGSQEFFLQGAVWQGLLCPADQSLPCGLSADLSSARDPGGLQLPA